MRKHDRDIFFKMIRGKVGFNELMKRHTTFRIGGPAEVWLEPADVTELRLIVRYANDNGIPLTVVGNGSNLLVSDHGVKGFVVSLAADDFKKIEIVGNTVVAGAGVSLPYLLQNMKEAGLGGLEPLVGIPGTIGGAVCMNAGIPGHWVGDVVRGVSVMERDGSIMAKDRDDLGFRYRGCDGMGESVILDVVLLLKPAPSDAIAGWMKHYREMRLQSQPQGSSAGCIFKNTEKFPAGYLIDRSGFKGTRTGGAVVSERHANFIVNEHEATANDVLELIGRIKASVLEREGIVLEPEVKIMGEGVYAN
ncbi:MAG TPA: UDP-N-acetylmuramate dehydrogenase [bacterium]|nr:UDP-N-acetylmuramate dehydrogenase [bacterium]